MELVKGLLHSIGVKASSCRLSELFRLVEQHCYWFKCQPKVQLNLKEWKLIQKELCQQHQKGNIIPLKLWTLCSAITQALALLSTDSETKSTKSEVIYEEVSNETQKESEAAALHDASAAAALHSRAGESDAKSDSSSESSSSSDGNDGVDKVTRLFQQWWKKQNEGTKKVPTPTAPPYASLSPVSHGAPDVGREGRSFSLPVSMFYDDDILAPSGGFIDPPQLFPIQRQAAPNNMGNVQYSPFEYKFFKDLKAAVAQYGPQSPFVFAMLDSIGKTKLVLPLGWEAMAQAVLEGSQCLQSRSSWEEEARKQARIHEGQYPPGPLEDKLMGEGQFRALRDQAQYSDQDLQQVHQVFLRAWRRVVPTGHAQPSSTKTLQGPNEPYTDFLARLRVAVDRAVGRDEISEILLQTLAFENANSECKRVLGPLKGQGASIAEYIRACSGVGGTEHNAAVFASALAQAMKPSKGGNCYHCGKPGHMKKDCRKLRAKQGYTKRNKPPGLCRRCGKGLHWTNECRSKTDKYGNPIGNPHSGNYLAGLSPRGPRTMPGTQLAASPTPQVTPLFSNNP
ncbi:endogenous retrovirus group K member 8 Gag polyprotein-like [Crocuta crocuta]